MSIGKSYPEDQYEENKSQTIYFKPFLDKNKDSLVRVKFLLQFSYILDNYYKCHYFNNDI